MSLQQSEMPEVSDETRPVAGRKSKPWVLWKVWRGAWYRSGRYRTQAEAIAVRDAQVRKYSWAAGLYRAEDFRVRHDSAGKSS